MSALMDDTTDAPISTPCRADPDAWFPHASDTGTEAKYICRSCPAIHACLRAALDFEQGKSGAERHGIWAGLTGAERAKLAGRS